MADAIQIQSGNLAASLAQPDASLFEARGSRFDLSGIVRQLTFCGHTFFLFDPASGFISTAEEFSTENPPGFADVAIGEGFHKIGVGLFRKEFEPYTNHKPSPRIRDSEWTVTHGTDWAEFRTEEERWLYTKRLTVSNDSLTVFRTLKNYGDMPLCTDHYSHNFLQIDGETVGPAYRLQFDSPLTLREARSRTLDCLEFDGQTLSLSRALSNEESLMLFFQTLENLPRQVAVENAQTGAMVSVETSLPVCEWRLFAASNCICPEPFVQLAVPPGESVSWETRYRFSSDSLQIL